MLLPRCYRDIVEKRIGNCEFLVRDILMVLRIIYELIFLAGVIVFNHSRRRNLNFPNYISIYGPRQTINYFFTFQAVIKLPGEGLARRHSEVGQETT